MHNRDVRASDRDRDDAAERLRLAVEEGCLDFGEFDERVGRAYRSATRGELADLVADLPEERRRNPPSPSPAGLPRWLKLVWTGWAVVFAVNVAVWAAVSVAEECPQDFWPTGMLPPALILAIVTAGIILRRRDATGEGS
ncbi:DUF1707 SHOCT-like domain-containing protein [Planomonospora venezuelensis]|uniref:DUF1707 domain-containing protein n=1 Tax=Planomonospora venezuelensis TaxID=1999 RepID=A0A841DHP1_PLAVE|nr:DUF1707 domain-containing protein [Planomonospora venezuelensis]MBB5967828.1 hypothetical protein [Planomonospora venezuelensis]GIN01236.1 hypothetical protein Pve01_28940 [Planomonospora venezuelensis]